MIFFVFSNLHESMNQSINQSFYSRCVEHNHWSYILKAFLALSPDVDHPLSKPKLCKDLQMCSQQATMDGAQSQPLEPTPWAEPQRPLQRACSRMRKACMLQLQVEAVFFLIAYKMKNMSIPSSLLLSHLKGSLPLWCQKIGSAKET